MNSTMDRKMHQQCRQRAVELGRSTNPAALPELIELLAMPSTDSRRLAASVCSKRKNSTSRPVNACCPYTPATNQTCAKNSAKA